jgi:TonB family protein
MHRSKARRFLGPCALGLNLLASRHQQLYHSASDAMSLSMLDGTERIQPPKLVHLSDMRAPLEQISGAPPHYTEALRLQGTGATATVQYVIDEAGRVRVPRVVSASSIDFARTALAAIKQWRFVPPTLDGRPVMVEDLRTFSVGPTREVARSVLSEIPAQISKLASNREIPVGGRADHIAIQN